MPASNENLCFRILTEVTKEYQPVTDISDINYTHREKRISKDALSSRELTEPYCDILTLVKIVDTKETNSNRCVAYLQRQLQEITFALSQSTILPDEAAMPLETNNTVRAIIRGVDVEKKFQNPMILFFKVDLADTSLDTIVSKMPPVLEELKKENYFLVDLRVIQDFVGVFNKEELKQYFIRKTKLNFCQEGDHDHEPDNCKVIIENSDTEGIAWKTSNMFVRIYNKFIDQMTTPPADKKIGNRIVDFIDCPNKRLRNTFSSSKAKQHGITRLEMVVFNYAYTGPEGIFDPLLNCRELLTSNSRYLQDENAPIYSVPIAKMWQKLVDKVRSCCCVVYRNTLQFVYWHNRNTGKFTGVQINLSYDLNRRDEQIYYALRRLSFNRLPINYFEVNEKGAYMTQKCFIKLYGDTYFTRSRQLDSSIPADVDISSTGLIRTDYVVPQVLRKGVKSNSTNWIMPIGAPKQVPIPCELEPEPELENIAAALQNMTIKMAEQDSKPTELQSGASNSKIMQPKSVPENIDRNTTIKIEPNDEPAEIKIKVGKSKTKRPKSEPKLDDTASQNTTIKPEQNDEPLDLTTSKTLDCPLDDFDIALSNLTINDEELLEKSFHKKSIDPSPKKTDPLEAINSSIQNMTIRSEEQDPKIISNFFNERNWKPLNVPGKYEIFAFTVNRRNRIVPRVGILAQRENTTDKKVYNLKGSKKDLFVDYHRKKLEGVMHDGYKVIRNDILGLDIVYLRVENPFAEFTIDHGRKVEEKNFRFFTEVWRIPQNLEETSLQNRNRLFGESRAELSCLFNDRNWIEMDGSSIYVVYAFTVVDLDVGRPSVGIFAQNADSRSKFVYHLGGDGATEFVELYKYLRLFMNGYDAIRLRNSYLMFLTTQQPLAKFNTNGTRIENLKIFK